MAMMMNMGTRKMIVACLDIQSRQSRKTALKSVFDMLTEILLEEEEYLRDLIDLQGPDHAADCVRHCSGFLIGALDSLQTALDGFDPNRPMLDVDYEDDIPF